MITDETLAKLSTPEKVLEHLELSDVALQKAAAAEEAQKVASDAVKALIGPTVQTMLQSGVIRKDQAEKSASILLSHAESLKLLAKVAQFVANQPSNIGKPADVAKHASADDWAEQDARFLEKLRG